MVCGLMWGSSNLQPPHDTGDPETQSRAVRRAFSPEGKTDAGTNEEDQTPSLRLLLSLPRLDILSAKTFIQHLAGHSSTTR